MKTAGLLGIALAGIASPAAFAYRAGPPAGANGSPQSGGFTCRQCHGNAAGPGSVLIIGAPARYRANRVYDITVRVADPNKLGAGFQISAEIAGGHAGTLLISDGANTQFADSFPPEKWVEHTGPGVDSAVAAWAAMGMSADYHVQWRAPASNIGTVTFYAAGNAINNNFTNSGDVIYLLNVSSTFDTCPADLNGDGFVSAADVALMLGAWGTTGAEDLDGGGVGASDLALLLGAWGNCA